ncbi:MAG: hypothetical protein ACLGJC_09420 [Alphaproteobacteria bacterium]
MLATPSRSRRTVDAARVAIIARKAGCVALETAAFLIALAVIGTAVIGG